MSTSAIILMVLVQVTVTIVTAYFFIKILRTPPNSFTENDDVVERQSE